MSHLKLCAVIRFLYIALILTALSGCASMFNPYLEVSKCPGNSKTNDGGDNPSQPSDGKGNAENKGCLSDAGLSEAISYAEGVKYKYRDALGDEAVFSNVLGTGLIALGAATLGLGITGAGTTAITILGLTGSTGYAIGAWLENKPRQQAYIMGYNATNCAIEAVLPLYFASQNPLYSEFKTAYTKIDNNIEAVEKQLGAVNKIISQDEASTNPDRERITRAKANVTAAESIVNVAKNARSSAVSLQREIDIAGGNLFTAVDRIVGQVDSVILDNQLNFAALTTIISGLGQAYGQFTTVPESLMSAKDISGQAAGASLQGGGSLEGQLESLQKKVSDLSTTTRKIADFVNTAVKKKPIEKLRICGVDPKTIASDITIDPGGPAKFIAGQNGTMVFLIKGGLQPYRAMLAGSQVTGLTISQSALFGPQFVVEVSSDTPAGRYSVYAVDGLGHQKILQVLVEAKGTNPGTPVKPGADATQCGSSSKTVFEAVGEQKRRKLQKATCLSGVEADALWGPKTCKAVIQYQKSKGETGDGNLTETLRDELLNLSDTTVEQRCKNPPPPGPELQDLEKFKNAIVSTSFTIENGTIAIDSGEVDNSARTVKVKLRIINKLTKTVTEDDLKRQFLQLAGTDRGNVKAEQIVIVDFAQLQQSMTNQ